MFSYPGMAEKPRRSMRLRIAVESTRTLEIGKEAISGAVAQRSSSLIQTSGDWSSSWTGVTQVDMGSGEHVANLKRGALETRSWNAIDGSKGKSLRITGSPSRIGRNRVLIAIEVTSREEELPKLEELAGRNS